MALQEQAATPQIDEAKVEAFMEKVIGDFSGTMMTCSARSATGSACSRRSPTGPATSAELAKRAGVNERYTLEWLRGMAAAGYLEHDRSSDSYVLPPEHALALAQEGSPMFFGGGYQMVPAHVGVFDQVAERFRNGGGVPQERVPTGLLGGPRAVHERLVRELPAPGVDPVDARREGEARAGLPLRGRRYRRRPARS